MHSPLPFLTSPSRPIIEQAVSRHIGRGWEITSWQDLHDLSSHPAAILSDDRYSIFAKLSDAANGLEQLEVEVAGLHRVHQLARVAIPTIIGLIETENGVVMLQEAVQSVERGVALYLL